MTTAKQLKARVRARMARTGERYAVARAHVVGGAVGEDNNCCDIPPIPDRGPPNNFLAPFWTDLDGTGAPGIFIATLTDGVDDWIVVESRLNVFGTSSQRVIVW